MEILSAHIFGYGKFIDKTFDFHEGMNLLIGPNEGGKTTLMSFIKAILYGHKKNEREGKDGSIPEYRKYKPWYTDQYGGYLIVQTEKWGLLRIERDFENKSIQIFDQENQEISYKFSFDKSLDLVGEDLLGLDLDTFINTAFIGQDKSIVNYESKAELAQKLINIGESGQEDISITDAINALKKYDTSLGNTRTKARPFNLKEEELSREKQELERMRQENLKAYEYLEEKRKLEKKIEKAKTNLQKEQSHKIYEETSKSIEKVHEYKNKIENLKKERNLENWDNEPSFKRQDKQDIHKGLQIAKIVLFLFTILAGIFIILSYSLPMPDKWLFISLFLVSLTGYIFVLLKKKSLKDKYRYKGTKIGKKEIDEQENLAFLEIVGHYEDLIEDILLKEDVADIESLYEKQSFYETDVKDLYLDQKENEKSLDSLKQDLAVINAAINRFYEENLSIAEQEEKVSEIEEDIKAILKEQEAIKQAIKGLEEAANIIKRERLPKINILLNKYLSKITSGKYKGIKIGKDLSLSNEYENKIRKIDSFSQGTLRQVYLSFRLACLESLDLKERVPLFLDEALVYFDKERRIRAYEFLLDLSKTRQIFFFATDKDDFNYKKEAITSIIAIE